jgi:hypothetical protein
MDWSRDSLYNKAKLFVQRAHDEDIESALFGFWTSLSLELLARAALSQIHPALLADPKEPDNLQYAFGKIPKGVPKSISAKALYARCSIFVDGFTDMMAGHCLVMADRRNSELHSGAAVFEELETSSWLPQTYEVIDVLLTHLESNFADFIGKEHKAFAIDMLKDRKDGIKKEVLDKISNAKQTFDKQSLEWKAERLASTAVTRDRWIAESRLRKGCACPACKSKAVMGGESVSRGTVKIDEVSGQISREVRVLPNVLFCPLCSLTLNGYQQMREAKLGDIYTVVDIEDPIEFFGIDPEEHVDIDKIVREYHEMEYNNE